MSTYLGSVRRGLPRVPGDEAWPSQADIEFITDVADPAIADQNAVHSEANDDLPQQSSTASLADASPAVSADPGSSSGQSKVLDQVLRTGLPRTPGGDPWPQAAVIQAAVQETAEVATSAEGQQAATVQKASVVATPSVPDAENLQPGQSYRELRTGLPREAGGPAYPEYTLVEAPEPVADQGFVAAQAEEPEAPSVHAPASPQATSVSQRSTVAPAPKPRDPAVQAAGSAGGKAPSGSRFMLSQSKPKNIVLWSLILLAEVVLVVFAARGLTSLPAVADFIARFPGETHLPEGETTGMPAWVRWQHFLNLFFMVLIIRSGIQIRREQRPGAYWTPSWSKGGAGKVSLTVWFHQCLDMLWLLNGLVFVIIMFATDHWMRIIPTSWEVFPNAISALLQYVSLDWPTENGWVNYNSLQQLMYALTIFVAAPLAAATGLRMSSLWPKNAKKLNAIYPVEVARAIHFPVMFYFVVFVIAHVALVFATGALRNLNHMYAGQDVVNWTGLLIFLGTVVLIVGAWLAARPIILAPIASLMGKVSSR